MTMTSLWSPSSLSISVRFSLNTRHLGFVQFVFQFPFFSDQEHLPGAGGSGGGGGDTDGVVLEVQKKQTWMNVGPLLLH